MKEETKENKVTKRVEFLFLKFQSPEIEIKSLSKFIEFTSFPYKLIIYDNRDQKDLNMSKIWNQFVRESTCEYLAIIDSDAFVTHEKWLTKLVETFDLVPDLCAVGPLTTSAGSKQAGHTKPLDFGFVECIISGFCFVFPKKVWEDIGPFDEEFQFYGQDSEFFLRARTKGYKVGFRTDVFVEHHGNFSIEQIFGHDVFLKEQKLGAEIMRKKEIEGGNKW